MLDLNLPDMSGLEVLRTLRVCKISTPRRLIQVIARMLHCIQRSSSVATAESVTSLS
jgi:CheY-like chemotaxis protein